MCRPLRRLRDRSLRPRPPPGGFAARRRNRRRSRLVRRIPRALRGSRDARGGGCGRTPLDPPIHHTPARADPTRTEPGGGPALPAAVRPIPTARDRRWRSGTRPRVIAPHVAARHHDCCHRSATRSLDSAPASPATALGIAAKCRGPSRPTRREHGEPGQVAPTASAPHGRGTGARRAVGSRRAIACFSSRERRCSRGRPSGHRPQRPGSPPRSRYTPALDFDVPRTRARRRPAASPAGVHGLAATNLASIAFTSRRAVMEVPAIELSTPCFERV